MTIKSNDSSIWKLTNELQWVKKQQHFGKTTQSNEGVSKGFVIIDVLQQKWVNVNTGERQWRDIPFETK